MADNNDKQIITVDVEKYAHFLEESGLSEKQQAEFLQAMWNVICEFVSLGFNVHPLQQIESCEQSSKNDAHATFLTPDMLECTNNNITDNAELDADLRRVRKGERAKI